ncbi:hypothetical protein LWI28_023922 [Acer negundo]|uniref:Uncharacterized protein n=1 Tax=Acer negundo TaxID=4023 RepID=A0AAD5NG53_ACENE|nr:hypothetical protein LWI28_023922 [Acer negundo]
MSMPDIYKSNARTFMLVGQESPIYIDNIIAHENVYGLNVSGNYISPSGDTGLFRSSYNDEPCIYGEAFGTLVITYNSVSGSLSVSCPNLLRSLRFDSASHLSFVIVSSKFRVLS